MPSYVLVYSQRRARGPSWTYLGWEDLSHSFAASSDEDAKAYAQRWWESTDSDFYERVWRLLRQGERTVRYDPYM